jgi:hypothetical protein
VRIIRASSPSSFCSSKWILQDSIKVFFENIFQVYGAVNMKHSLDDLERIGIRLLDILFSLCANAQQHASPSSNQELHGNIKCELYHNIFERLIVLNEEFATTEEHGKFSQIFDQVLWEVLQQYESHAEVVSWMLPLLPVTCSESIASQGFMMILRNHGKYPEVLKQSVFVLNTLLDDHLDFVLLHMIPRQPADLCNVLMEAIQQNILNHELAKVLVEFIGEVYNLNATGKGKVSELKAHFIQSKHCCQTVMKCVVKHFHNCDMINTVCNVINVFAACPEGRHQIHCEMVTKHEETVFESTHNVAAEKDEDSAVQHNDVTSPAGLPSIHMIPTEEIEIGSAIDLNVFQGTWMHTSVVLKLSASSSLELSDTFNIERQVSWQHELEVLSKLRHPRVVSLLGYCHLNLPWNEPALVSGDPCQCRQTTALVVEHMTKGNLRTLLSTEYATLTVLQKARIALDISEGMRFLHSLNMFHRDLKSYYVLTERS